MTSPATQGHGHVTGERVYPLDAETCGHFRSDYEGIDAIVRRTCHDCQRTFEAVRCIYLKRGHVPPWDDGRCKGVADAGRDYCQYHGEMFQCEALATTTGRRCEVYARTPGLCSSHQRKVDKGGHVNLYDAG